MKTKRIMTGFLEPVPKHKMSNKQLKQYANECYETARLGREFLNSISYQVTVKFEGNPGSGKGTGLDILLKALKRKGFPCKRSSKDENVLFYSLPKTK